MSPETHFPISVRAGGKGGMTGMHAGIARCFAASAPLAWTGLALLLLSIPTLLLSVVDVRQLQGVSVWLKPWKFQLSTGSYLLTLAWVMVYLAPAQRGSPAGRYVVWTGIGSALFEVAYISWQAAWGQASHFNVGTPFDAAMYTLMGVGAVLLTSTAMVLGVMVWRDRRVVLPPALHESVAWGLMLTCVLGTGFGAYMSAQTGHWVQGEATDAGGMVLTHWSRSGGDLRVAHFFGVHAVHILVLWVWLVGRARLWLAPGLPQHDAPVSLGFVRASAVAYSLFALWTFAQAYQGRPFFA